MKESKKWKMWKAILDFKTCLNCRRNNGKIYSIDEMVYPDPPLHQNGTKQTSTTNLDIEEQREYYFQMMD